MRLALIILALGLVGCATPKALKPAPVVSTAPTLEAILEAESSANSLSSSVDKAHARALEIQQISAALLK
jgi:hypothetical protein